MADTPVAEADPVYATTPEPGGPSRRRGRGWRIAGAVLLGLLLLTVLLAAGAWWQRAPIAGDVLDRELARRGVQARYRITKLGLSTERLEDVVIGDPRRPDLTADWAEVLVSTRWRWAGLLRGWPLRPEVTVRRITARGVRLNGRLVGGKLRLGQIDRLLPPPSGKPFAFPDFAVDLDRTTIRLDTSAGIVGLALRGRGRLSDGFRGQVAASVPRLVPAAGCVATGVRGQARVAIDARSPRFIGPVTATALSCPRRGIDARRLVAQLDIRLPEGFSRWHGRARLDLRSLGIARGTLDRVSMAAAFDGDATVTTGALRLGAEQARFAGHAGRRLRYDGGYRVTPRAGGAALLGDVALDDLAMSARVRSSLTRPLLAVAGTPLAPLGTAASAALDRATRSIDLRGRLRLVHGAAGGAARLRTLRATGGGGVRLGLAGGEGLSYFWPSGRVGIDGEAALSGGGLPTMRLAFDQPRPGALVGGVLRIAPYAAGDARLALAPVRFSPLAGGGFRIDTVATLDGSFPGGRVEGLNLPVAGSFGQGGFAFNAACVPAGWNRLRVSGLNLGPSRFRLCPLGRGLLYRDVGGKLAGGASVADPSFAGTLGTSPIRLTAADARYDLADRRFAARDLRVRLGTPASESALDLAVLEGRVLRDGAGGRFAGARGDVGNVPLILSDGSGDWRLARGDLLLTGGLTVADAAADPRFYPLRADAARLTLADNRIAATATLRDPESGTKVSDVRIAHDLRAGVGDAVLDVPGIAFGPKFQPEALTRLTTGVVALVNGIVRGQGLVRWNGTGVTSIGRFSTDDLDLAAAFGPVTGIKGEIVFSDLLGLSTAPGQSIDIAEINPGIPVAGGKLRYQLLPGQRVRIEGAFWPYAGGELLLDETVLELGRPAPKRLTFRVRGMDAALFVDQFEFENIAAAGVFDGVIPMVFDERGGRIEGGDLQSRAGGGTLAYIGVLSNQQLGRWGKLAFDALKELRYSSMNVYLDGDLSGEFLSRFRINGRNQNEKARGLLKQITGIPFNFNIAIRGQFRALLATARSFSDPSDLIRQTQPLPVDAVPGVGAIQPRSSEKRP